MKELQMQKKKSFYALIIPRFAATVDLLQVNRRRGAANGGVKASEARQSTAAAAVAIISMRTYKPILLLLLLLLCLLHNYPKAQRQFIDRLGLEAVEMREMKSLYLDGYLLAPRDTLCFFLGYTVHFVHCTALCEGGQPCIWLSRMGIEFSFGEYAAANIIAT